jgi:DNA-binding LytR/AlgR family response regulator
MMDCVIIEDLKVAADYLTKCCTKSARLNVLGHFPDVPSALEFLNKNSVDLLFLDVEMPGATGFQLLDELAYKPKVILTTSKEEYAYNAFEYRVVDFLKKPFTYNRFIEALDKVEDITESAAVAESPLKDYLFIKSEGKLIRLGNDDILYIESDGDYVKFVTKTKKYLTYNSIKKLEEKVNKAYFMKVHRAYIINLHKIDDVRETEISVNGVTIPMSKNVRPDVIKKLNIL